MIRTDIYSTELNHYPLFGMLDFCPTSFFFEKEGLLNWVKTGE